MKKLCKGVCLSLLLLISTFSWAQNKTVSGKVLGEKGSPVVKASVLVKNTTIGTSTNDDGSFTLSVPSSVNSIQISAIGYELKNVTLTGSYLTISLTIMEVKLDEVVVVGYGTQKKSVITGAISSVRARDIEKIPTGRIEQALQGRVSGVTIASNSGQPGSASTIRVRGVTTFGGGNNPLWVVDGVVVDAGGIGYLNQSDIESIEVLKDASSAAIYGTRAASGVILVTTKKGKAGKMTVGYDGFYGTSAPAKMLDLLNATQYGALLNERSVAGGGNVIFSNLGALGVGTDWQKAIFNNNANRYSHQINLSGGSDKSTYYVSFGIQDQKGIVASDISGFSQYNVRLNATHKISKIFTFGQTLGYAHQKAVGLGNTNSEFGGPLSSAINLDPITPIVITDPSVAAAAPYSVNPVVRDANGNPYGISSIVGQEMTNPLAYIQTRLGAYDWSDNFVGNAFLDVEISSKFKFRSTFGAKLAYWGGQGFTPIYYLSATNSVLQNSYSKYDNNRTSWNLENTLTYSNKINKHDFTILVGQGAYQENIGGGSSVTIYNLPISNYKDASFGFNIPSTDRVSSVYSTDGNPYGNIHKNTSLFGRVNYNFDEKYLFTGIFRRDGSSRFGKNYRFGYFPSFSLGWIVSKENFWKSSRVINQLKVRGGYGKVGNDAISEYGYLSTVLGGSNYTFGNNNAITTGYAQSSLDNPDLHWEQTTQANIGIEAQLFHSLNVTIDLFNKKTSGILRPITIPGYVGVASSPLGNVADMENKGIELELGYRTKIGQVNFSANGNVAYLQNKVTYVASDANYINGDAAFQSMGSVTRTQVGQSYNSFYGYQKSGIYQNMAEILANKNSTGGLLQPTAVPGDFKWVDTNGDGKIDDNDRVFLGSNIPKYTFGLTLNAEYKGFDVMVFAQGSAGSKIFQGLRRLDIGNSNYQTKAMSRWTGEGTSNDYPRLTSNDANGNFGKMSDFYLESGDYIRIKVVQLGYTLPVKISGKIGATKVRFYATAENLFTLTKYTGYDPEIGGGVFGIDKGIYPQARSFMFGAQLQF